MAKTRICATVLALALSALPLSAHHGWSNYGTEEFTLTGAVDTTVSYAGPHATMKVRANGQVWNIVLSAGTRVAAAGLKEGMIPVGSQVTILGSRAKNGSNLVNALSFKLPDGRCVFAGTSGPGGTGTPNCTVGRR